MRTACRRLEAGREDSGSVHINSSSHRNSKRRWITLPTYVLEDWGISIDAKTDALKRLVQVGLTAVRQPKGRSLHFSALPASHSKVAAATDARSAPLQSARCQNEGSPHRRSGRRGRSVQERVADRVEAPRLERKIDDHPRGFQLFGFRSNSTCSERYLERLTKSLSTAWRFLRSQSKRLSRPAPLGDRSRPRAEKLQSIRPHAPRSDSSRSPLINYKSFLSG